MLPLNGTSLGTDQISGKRWKLNLTYFFPRDLPDRNQNLTYTRSAHLLLEIYRNLKFSHNHSQPASKTDYHMFCIITIIFLIMRSFVSFQGKESGQKDPMMPYS